MPKIIELGKRTLLQPNHQGKISYRGGFYFSEISTLGHTILSKGNFIFRYVTFLNIQMLFTGLLSSNILPFSSMGHNRE